MKCKKCGHEWEVRKEKPLCCPRCKRYDYDELNDEVDKNENTGYKSE